MVQARINKKIIRESGNSGIYYCHRNISDTRTLIIRVAVYLIGTITAGVKFVKLENKIYLTKYESLVMRLQLDIRVSINECTHGLFDFQICLLVHELEKVTRINYVK